MSRRKCIRTAQPTSGDRQSREVTASDGVDPVVSPLPPELEQALALAANTNGGGDAELNSRDLFVRCESIISNALTATLAAGIVLEIVRSRRLYELHNYRTFDQYCAQVWQFSRARANQLIRAARVMRLLGRCRDVSVLPTNEPQVHALGRASPEEQIAIWQRVAKTTAPHEITAQVVADHVMKFLRERAQQTPEEPDAGNACVGEALALAVGGKTAGKTAKKA